jgi:hypothetical protein
VDNAIPTCESNKNENALDFKQQGGEIEVTNVIMVLENSLKKMV